MDSVQFDKKQALWYTEPASDWMSEALPIGNGAIGAMIFGGVAEEQIQFTEETMFAGGPGSHPEYNYGIIPGSGKELATVRKLLDKGQYQEAEAHLHKQIRGNYHPTPNTCDIKWGDFGWQLPLGDVRVAVDNRKPCSDYCRWLDLATGRHQVSYRSGDVHHQRESFGSYPEKLIVSRFTNDDADGCEYQIALELEHDNIRFEFDFGVLTAKGTVLHNGLKFETHLLVNTDGAIQPTGQNHLKIVNARFVELYLTAETDYENRYPDYRQKKFISSREQVKRLLISKDYSRIQQQAETDYQTLFSRVQLELGENKYSHLPTDQRLHRHHEQRDDRGLEALYFQYARYLLIAASRPGCMPSYLQGKWNNTHDPAWTNDFHLNINEQMIYWPAEVTNLSETHQPLLDYIQTLEKPGTVVAKENYLCGGWAVNHMNNPFGFVGPNPELPCGWFPASAAWLCQHLWEHYAFNQDKHWLQGYALPLMQGAARFWLDYLTEDNDGTLVSSPSFSPEHGGISKSAFMDLEIVHDLFSNVLSAYDELGTDDDLKHQIESATKRLSPLKIGRWGQLQEWKEDVDDPECNHRHISHLFALHPGHQVSPLKTPELAEAAKKTLISRGDDGTGWSKAWKANFWARLYDGNKALELLGNMFKPMTTGDINYFHGGTYNNLLCAHPPFQLDGSMGALAGMAEMLVQSHEGCINLLPACPASWHTGSVKGLRVRGGGEIEMSWENRQLTGAIFTATTTGLFKLACQDQKWEVRLQAGEIFNLMKNA